MKTIYLSLGLFFVFSITFSQETPLRIDYTPNSPDVSSLFDFTDVSTGNYTGSININIPITSLSQGPLSTSVSLSYNSSGNKVSQRATWVGLSWNLNAGGTIGREVRGIPDDTDAGIGFLEFLSSNQFTSINDVINLSTADKLNLYDDLAKFGCKDAQPDIFSFRIGDLSGTFMFDWDGNIKVASNRKIQVTYIQLPNSNEIDQWDITDDYGNKYAFSKKERNDRTGIYGMGVVNCSNNPYTTAWKLTSMQDSSGQHQIDFTYEDYTMNYPIEYSKQESLNVAGAHIAYSSSGSGLDIDGSYLKSITTNNSQNKIEFSTDLSSPRTDVSGTNLYPLGSIKLKDKNNTTITEYTFDYTLANRLRLDKINKFTTASTIGLYEFEYNTTPLPLLYDSYSTDHWGYYNGVSNSVPYSPLKFTGASGTIINLPGADKNPSATNSEANVLKKIIYPTKGYSEFVYEGHDYSFIQSDLIPAQYDQIYVYESSTVTGLPTPNTGTLVTDEEYFDVVINTTGTNENTICDSGPCKRRISISVQSVNISPFAGQIVGPRYQIYDSNNQLVHQILSVPYDPNKYCNGGYYIEFDEIWLEEGTYKLVTETRNEVNSLCPVVSNYINVGLSYDNDGGFIYKKDVGGVRIKEIAEYNYDGSLIKKKAFEYVLNNTPNLSSGSIDALPDYEDFYFFYNGNPAPPFETQQIARYSGSLLQLGSSFGHVRYSEVTVNQVSGSEILKTVYKYSNGDDDVISFAKPYSPASSKAYKKGLLMNETAYKSVGSSFSPVSEINYLYDYKNNSIQGLKIGYEISGDCGCSYGLEVYAEGYYTSFIGYNQLINKKVKTVFDISSIEQENTLIYDTDLNRVTSTLNNTSENETILTEYKYPDTDSPSTINTAMVSKNIISVPIKTEVSINGNLLSTQYILYKDWGNNIILPEKVQSVKGIVTTSNLLEDRTQIHNYDISGNPLEVSKSDGSHIYYIWGYNASQPIAKIENFTNVEATNIQSLITAAVDASNLDNDRKLDVVNPDGSITYIGMEGVLRQALSNIRNSSALDNSQMISYTYDPLIGITSITDPNDYTTYYQYDAFNRLIQVKDADGMIVSENNYHYKGQQ